MTDQLITRETGAIYEVLFNRPEKHNAISNDMLNGLRDAIDYFATASHLRVMRLGAVGKYFTAGVQIDSDISPDVGDSTLDGRQWYRSKFHQLFDEFEAVEKPIVATHQGICLGGGLELSLSCDFRLAAKSASYGLPEINIGALPGSGGISRLTRVAGPHWTRWLVMAGEQVSATEAVSMGFVHKVYDDEDFEEQVMAFCQKLADQAGGSNHVFTVDLEAQIVTGPDGEKYAFDVDAGRKANLMAGLDEIGSSLTAAGAIDTFEAKRRVSMPWLETRG